MPTEPTPGLYFTRSSDTETYRPNDHPTIREITVYRALGRIQIDFRNAGTSFEQMLSDAAQVLGVLTASAKDDAE